ncbi:MAG: YiiD C-terminal domain-containing protein [Planctomycetes bacterium]|nr:YiiD C-terminal domain-containing protein [Planctomycetota bacterium]
MARVAFRGPRRLKPWQLRWMLNLYPPFLAQRIRAVECSADYLRVRLEVRRSIWTRNLNGTTFGGTLYAACDPVYPLMYWQALGARGIELQTWLMAAEIEFKKPASTTVSLEFQLCAEDLAAAEAELQVRGKSIRTHEVQVLDRDGVLCARAETVSYLRPLPRGERGGTAF